MFLKNRNISSKIKRSKVTDYAALMQVKSIAAILSTFIKLPYVIKIFVLSISYKKYSKMLHNVYISRCETCLSAAQETAGSGLNRLYNVLFAPR